MDREDWLNGVVPPPVTYDRAARDEAVINLRRTMYDGGYTLTLSTRTHDLDEDFVEEWTGSDGEVCTLTITPTGWAVGGTW